MVILKCEVDGEVRREMPVWRPMTPAPMMIMCFLSVMVSVRLGCKLVILYDVSVYVSGLCDREVNTRQFFTFKSF